MLHQRLEEAALNAWPALQQMLFDGWILRFADGYSKRANSITPLFPSQQNVLDKIAVCERLYAAHGLPAVFRLLPFASPQELDRVLAQRGYRVIDQTYVMHCDTQALGRLATPTLALEQVALSDWMHLLSLLHPTSVTQQQTHARILGLIPATPMYAVLRDAGHVVACGVGVLENDLLGLFDLITESQQRNKGYGTQLVTGMLHWGREHGATHAYLQVLQRNAPAHHLYTKLGFRNAYPYWYRVPPMP